MYQAVEWDWDGSLNPNLELIHKLYLKLKRKGKNLTEFRQTVEPDIDRYLYNEGIRELGKVKTTQKIYLKYLQKRGKLIKGGKEILQYVNNLSVPQGIASESSRRVYITTVLERTGTSDLVNVIVAKEDRKDNANKWELLAKRMGVGVKDCIAIDDMKQGIMNAKNAGVGKVYGVTYGYHTRKQIVEANPAEIIDNVPMLYNKLSADLGVGKLRQIVII